jgi:hypothetical protein
MEERERCYSFALSWTPHETLDYFIVIVNERYIISALLYKSSVVSGTQQNNNTLPSMDVVKSG